MAKFMEKGTNFVHRQKRWMVRARLGKIANNAHVGTQFLAAPSALLKEIRHPCARSFGGAWKKVGVKIAEEFFVVPNFIGFHFSMINR